MTRVANFQRHFRTWNRAGLFAALAAAAFLLAALVGVRLLVARKPFTVTISAGNADGLAELKWMALDGEVPGGGLRARPILTAGSLDMLERVDRGQLDFALVQGGFDIDRFRNVRQVAGLAVLPLTLLVKERIHEAVLADLGALRSRSINLGSGTLTGTYWLSRDLLAFAGLAPGDYRPTALTVEQLAGGRDPETLPDAIFLVAKPPAPLIRHLTAGRRYRLVPLPFGDAFRALALEREAETPPEGIVVRKEHVPDAVIPAYCYGVSPAIPPRDLPTIGSRILLVTHRRTHPSAVIRVLQTLFESRWAKAVQPPLTKSVLLLPPEAPLHPGAIEFRDRDQPVITGDSLSALSNALQILLPICGGLLFLRGWLKDRISAGRERSFDQFFALVTEVERRGTALKRGGTLDREAVHRLSHDLNDIKDSAFQYIVGAETTVEGFTAILLAHIGDARAYLAELQRRADAPDEESQSEAP